MSQAVLEATFWLAILAAEIAVVLVVGIRSPREFRAGHIDEGRVLPVRQPTRVAAVSASSASRFVTLVADRAAWVERPSVSGAPPWDPAPRPPGVPPR